jgi:hypothetical protein
MLSQHLRRCADLALCLFLHNVHLLVALQEVETEMEETVGNGCWRLGAEPSRSVREVGR